MKESTMKRAIDGIQKDCPGTDAMIVTRESDGNVCVSLCGNPTNIAQALFATVYDTKHQRMAQQVYNIVKNVVYNILCNPSPIANDLLSMMAQLAEAESGESAKIVELHPKQ